MDGRSILIAFIPVVLTLVNYAIVRDMLWGILLGNKSKKSALKHSTTVARMFSRARRTLSPCQSNP